MTDTELLILNHAARDPKGHAWPFPETQGPADMACERLLKNQYLKRAAHSGPTYFGTARGVGPFIPAITKKGCDALNLLPEQRPSVS